MEDLAFGARAGARFCHSDGRMPVTEVDVDATIVLRPNGSSPLIAVVGGWLKQVRLMHRSCGWRIRACNLGSHAICLGYRDPRCRFTCTSLTLEVLSVKLPRRPSQRFCMAQSSIVAWQIIYQNSCAQKKEFERQSSLRRSALRKQQDGSSKDWKKATAQTQCSAF